MEMFDAILRGAVESGASDIHIKAGGPVIFRIRRALQPVESPAITEEWIASLLEEVIPASMLERFRTEREIDFALQRPGVGRVRVNAFQQRGNVAVAIRLVPSQARGFQDLRLPEIVRRIADAQRGIIIIAGAPGAGKSTTLAAILQHMNQTSRRHIVTLEDPIEYSFTDELCVIEQREVGIDTATFASGLRNILRQDPDVLVIGEMRDPGGVAAAVTAANLGALVITTLHTGDAPRSFQRILEFYPADSRDQARRQLAATLHAIICQKLIPAAKGGIVPAVEVLLNTAGVSKLLETDRIEKLHGAMELGTADGMQTFEQALYALAKGGAITQAEALRHAPNPEALQMRLQGVVLNEGRRILGARD